MRPFERTPLDLALISMPQGRLYLRPERCKGCEMCLDFLCPEFAIFTLAVEPGSVP